MSRANELDEHFKTAEGCITRAVEAIKKRGFPDDENDKAKNGVLAELGKAKAALGRLRNAAQDPQMPH